MANNVQYVNMDKIKNLTKEKGFTMKHLCDQMGKHRSFLSNVKTGKDHLDENELKFICEKLNTTPEYLTDQTEQKEKPISDERQANKKPPNISEEVWEEVSTKFGELNPDNQLKMLELIQLYLTAQDKK